MNSRLSLFVVVLFLFFGASHLFSQSVAEEKSSRPAGSPMAAQERAMKERMKKMNPPHGAPGHIHSNDEGVSAPSSVQLAPFQDGSFVLVSEKHLLKFDPQLNIVRQVSLSENQPANGSAAAEEASARTAAEGSFSGVAAAPFADGTLVVFSNGKLMRYDRRLDLVQEAVLEEQLKR